jgi:hypothetical protein
MREQGGEHERRGIKTYDLVMYSICPRKCHRWHLSSFNNVKALRIRDGFIEELSRCLRLEDGWPGRAPFKFEVATQAIASESLAFIGNEVEYVSKIRSSPIGVSVPLRCLLQRTNLGKI